jgi:REP-associated tyrosine transposase
MKKKTVREKLHRLPNEMYVGYKTVAFTICVKDNQKLFISEEVFENIEQKLITSLQHYKCSANVYLFMPDHLHLIVEGHKVDSNIKMSIELFKQKTGYWLSKNLPNFKWQKDYYDHIIRNDEDVQNQIRYILNNPVRANLVENWKEYPYKGSTIYNLDEWE